MNYDNKHKISAIKELDKIKTNVNEDNYKVKLNELRNFYIGVMQRDDVKITSYIYCECMFYIEEITKRLDEEIPQDVLQFHQDKLDAYKEYQMKVASGEINPTAKPKRKSIDKKEPKTKDSLPKGIQRIDGAIDKSFALTRKDTVQ